MRLIRTVVVLLLLAAVADVLAASIVRQADVVVRGENDPLDAPLDTERGGRP